MIYMESYMIQFKKIMLSILMLISLSTFYSNASIVSENDGSAFITKSEFEQLKSDFNKQINKYEQSVMAKVDGAIASYLAAIKLEKQDTIDSLIYKANEAKNVTFVGDYYTPVTHLGGHAEIAAQIVFKRDAAAVVHKGTNAPTTGYVWKSGDYWIVPNHFVIKIGYRGGQGNANPMDTLDIRKLNTDANQKNIVYKIATSSTIKNKVYTDSDKCYDLTPRLTIFSVTVGYGGQRITIVNGGPAVAWEFATGSKFSDFSGKNFGYQSSSLVWHLENTCDSYAYTYPTTHDYTASVAAANVLSCREETYDTTYNKYIDYLAGNKIPEDSKIYVVNENDWNVCDDNPLITVNTKWQAYIQYYYFTSDTPTGDGTQYNVGQADYNASDLGIPDVKVWMKKNRQIPIMDLIHDDWSQKTGKTVNYYSGIPICESLDKQVIEVNLKFTNSSATAAGKFSVRDDSFKNVNLETPNITLYKDKELTQAFSTSDYNISAGTSEQRVTFYIDASKEKTYWLKVCPSSTNTIKVVTDEKFVSYVE